MTALEEHYPHEWERRKKSPIASRAYEASKRQFSSVESIWSLAARKESLCEKFSSTQISHREETEFLSQLKIRVRSLSYSQNNSSVIVSFRQIRATQQQSEMNLVPIRSCCTYFLNKLVCQLYIYTVILAASDDGAVAQWQRVRFASSILRKVQGSIPCCSILFGH